MLQLQIYFNGQQLDLFKDESIVLTQSIQDIKDIKKIFVPFSQTFNVPASKNNNKIFKHFYNFNIVGYDARKKTPSELYLNYKLFKKGKINLEGVQLKNNEPHTYKLTFFGNTINLKDILGEDKIATLDQLRHYSFNYNNSNIQAYLTNGLDVGEIEDAVIIPLITHTSRLIYDSNSSLVNTDTVKNINPSAGTTTDYGVPFTELKPAIRLYAIIKAIEVQYGLTFSTDFFNTSNTAFYGLYMWLHNKEGELFKDQEAQHQISGFDVTKNEDNVFTGIKNSSFETLIDDIKQTTVFKNKPIDKILRRINVRVVPNNSALYSLVIKKDGEEFQRFNGLTGSTELGQSTTLKEKNWLDIDDGDYTFFIETNTVSDYSVTISSYIKVDRTLGIQRDLIFTGTASKTTDSPITAAKFIPDIKIIDLLTGIFKLFNLTAFEDDNGIIQVKTLDEFYASSTKSHNITEYLNKEELTVDSVLPYKQINFSYEGTKSFLANNHKETHNKEWGALNYNASEKYKGNIYEITVPFEHFKFENLFITNNGTNSGTDSDVQYGYSVNAQQQPYLGKPLLFYAAKSTATIRAIYLTANQGISISNPYIPLNCQSKGSTFITGNQSINFNDEFDEFSREVNPESIFKNYYKNYIDDMFDVRKRITNVKAFLPMSLIYDLNLADKFILNNNEYRINKISTNFENGQSTIELTNVFEAPVFRTLKAMEYNGLTVDSTNVSADSIDVTIDATTDNQFTIPNTNTGIPNTTLNNPTSVFVDTSLVVTPPTIAFHTIPAPTATEVYFAHKITALGKVGQTQKLDEYGYLYSTSNVNINSTEDIDTLKGFGDITVIPFLPSLASLIVPIESNYKKTGLTDPATIYYRFYARTNTDPANDKADAVSSVVSVSTISTSCSQYHKNVGFLVGDQPITFTYTTQEGIEKTLSALQFSQGVFGECICKATLVADADFSFYDPFNAEQICT